MFAIRLDKSPTATGNSISFLLHRHTDAINRALVVAEGDDVTLKRHYHIYLEYVDKDHKITAIRKLIERTFENRGASKAVAVCKKPEQYLSYILKDYDIVYKQNFTIDELADYHERSYKKKNTRPTIVQELIEKVKITYKNPVEMDIIDSVYAYYAKRGKPMDFRHMKNVFKAVYAHFEPRKVKEEFSEFCWK